MTRKIIISILTLTAGLCFYLANHSISDEENEQRQKKIWTEAANVFLDNQVKYASVIRDSVIRSENIPDLPSEWGYFEFDGNRVSYWTTNEWLPDSAFFHSSKPFLAEHKSGWDLIIPVSQGKSLISRKLTRRETGQFEYENFIPPLRNTRFEIQQKETECTLLFGSAHLSFYGKSGRKTGTGKLHIFSYLALLLASVLAFRFWNKASIALALLAISARILSIKGMAKGGLDQLDIFDPMIFASSNILPSLGDLALHIVASIVVTLAIVCNLSKKTVTSEKVTWAMLFITSALALFGADLIRSLIGSLVLNSKISFDISNLSSINAFTVVSVILIAILFWLWYALISSLLRSLEKKTVTIGRYTIMYVLASLAFVGFQYFDAHRTLQGLLPSILFTTVCMILFYWTTFQTKRNPGLYKYIAYILLFSLFYSVTLYVHQKNREQEYLNLYASKLISNKDLQAEYLFKDMENSLAQKFLQPKDFKAFSEEKEEFEQRLRRLYFSGYLDKYNMLVLSFDSLGNNINSSTLYNIDDLNEMYNFKSFPTLSNHFYQVKSDRIFNGYLAKFENCDLNGHYGSVFILLEPKFIQSSYEYPQLVSRKKDSRIFDLDDYSYALYSGGLLLNQKGTFPYNLHYDSTYFAKKNTIFNRSSFRHYVSNQGEAIVVLSHPNNLLKTAVSTFSFAFILYILLFASFGLLWLATSYFRQLFIKKWRSSRDYKEFKFKREQQLARLGIEQVYLSTRIRLAMVVLVFAGLLVSIYVTIQFIEINDQNRSENELMYKIREVANQLQNEVDFAKKLENPESRQLIVNEIGDVHKIDANLFDSSGRLLASSIEDIYEQELLAPLMDPRALATFKNQKTSQLVHSENIRNLHFISAYLPLINDKRKVIAYLNLPYYSRQNELNNEISSYTVTFVNLYLFLILVAIALAYVVSQRISKPLQIIREKMSKTGLKTNELIEWKQNDEIGRLVKQYNKMVLQLADSAQKLTESEREGAWKEMARQVAHEIKNPLTPMKLNIQHLQRAWADKNERLEETFKRVTTVLIEQIDSLSKLATEFSSFAKMPVNSFEKCNLTNSLLSTITLFEKSENVAFQYDSDFPPVMVFADREQLGRVFNNVIKNAIQAIPSDKKGLIKIELLIENGTVRVEITDNGKGIAEEDRTRIFVPNFSTKNSGMGLGLAITRKMVEAAEGRIWFESTVDEGTTFYIEWPILEE